MEKSISPAKIKRFKSSRQRIGTLANKSNIYNATKYVYTKANHKPIVPPSISKTKTKTKTQAQAQAQAQSTEAMRNVRVTPASGVNIKKRASERVRTKVRRVKQSAQLGGYWTFANGKSIFVSTVGRKASFGKRRKPNRAPTPNQTTNIAQRKPKEKLVKRPKKKRIPKNIQKIRTK